jgi:dipeptidyl-peptidase-4
VQDRIQTWMELNTADPETGGVTKILREESDTWVNRLPFPRWQADGSFLWFSERTGYRHIYHYEADGKLRRQLTSGGWQVRQIVRVGKDWIWFTGTKDGAINNNLYRVDWQGKNLTRLTHGEGSHSTSLNKAGTWFLDTVSSVTSPSEVRLCKGDGSKSVVLARSKPRDVLTHAYCPKQRLTIKARDDYPLDATVIKPLGFEPSSNKKYPIYLPTYSGPNAPSVRNRFGSSTWQQFLAQRGVLILQVNVRSASGRGMAHTGQCYKRLGVVELRDLEDAVDHVCKHFAGDPERVAIDGWSYGGFMAAYALTHSDKFSLGLAGAGVHDWRLYDTIYTERYMSTPQLNKEGYEKTSSIKAAKNLSGHLVLMHGTMDDNVHMQNSIQLLYALQRAGKDDFELMLYPKSRHGVGSRHRQRMVWRAIRDNFKLQP